MRKERHAKRFAFFASSRLKFLEFVERMLALHRQLAAAKLEHGQIALKRQIAATDRRIDQLVYELYDLSEEEIKIVEGQA